MFNERLSVQRFAASIERVKLFPSDGIVRAVLMYRLMPKIIPGFSSQVSSVLVGFAALLEHRMCETVLRSEERLIKDLLCTRFHLLCSPEALGILYSVASWSWKTNFAASAPPHCSVLPLSVWYPVSVSA